MLSRDVILCGPRRATLNQLLDPEKLGPSPFIVCSLGNAAVRVVTADGDVEAILHLLGGRFGGDVEVVGGVSGDGNAGFNGEAR